MDSRQEVKSLKKALRALTFLNQRVDSTATEVASAINVPRPTAYRILETLASEGYVEKQPHSGIYRITSQVNRLASGFSSVELLLEIAKPHIYKLSGELGWPLLLSTVSAPYVIARINTDFDCALAIDRYHLGYSFFIMNSSSGYCYLANIDAKERKEVVEWSLQEAKRLGISNAPDSMRYLDTRNGLNHMTRFNNMDQDEINYLIDTVQIQGFCNIEHKLYREGNLAVPLCIDGKPIGGIVMRYIKSVLKNTGRIGEVYVPKLRAVSQEILAEYQERLAALKQQDNMA